METLYYLNHPISKEVPFGSSERSDTSTNTETEEWNIAKFLSSDSSSDESSGSPTSERCYSSIISGNSNSMESLVDETGFNQLAANFTSYSSMPHNGVNLLPLPIQAPNMEMIPQQFDATNYNCDNNINFNVTGHLYATQNSNMPYNTQYCDRTTYDYGAGTLSGMFNIAEQNSVPIYDAPGAEERLNEQDLFGQPVNVLDNTLPEDLDLNKPCVNSTIIGADNSNSKTDFEGFNMPDDIFEADVGVTIVDRKVDTQLNSSNVVSNSDVDHIEESLLDNLCEDDIDNSFLQDINGDDFISQLKEEQIHAGLNYPCEQDISNVQVNDQYVPEIFPKVEIKTEPINDHYQMKTKPKVLNGKPHAKKLSNIISRPKVAGRKKIDTVAGRYIIDDDDEDKEEIDIVTVPKEDNPLIEAKDVDSLLEQFESTQIRKDKPKDQKRSKQKLSRIQKEKMEKAAKKELKIQKLREISSRKSNSVKDETKCKNSRSDNNLANSSRLKHKNGNRKIDEMRGSSKLKDLRSNEKGNLSKSQSTSHDSMIKIPEEQKKNDMQRLSNDSKPMKDVKIKPIEKHNTHKSQETNQPKSAQLKTSSKSCHDKTTRDVPKDLIGRIKEGNKPRTIKLLEDASFLGEFIVDKRKKRLKPQGATKNVSANKSIAPLPSTCEINTPRASCKSVSVGTSTSSSIPPMTAKPAATSITARLTATSMMSRPTYSSLVSQNQTVIQSTSTPTNNVEQAREINDKSENECKFMPIKKEIPVIGNRIQTEKCSSKSTNGKLSPSTTTLIGKTINGSSQTSLEKSEPSRNTVGKSKSIQTPSKEHSGDNSKAATAAPKKVWNFEDYIKHKGARKSNNSPESEHNGTKPISHDEWVRKMALDAPPPPPEGMICLETHDVAVDACLVEKSVILHLESLEQLKKDSKGKIDENSFLNCFKDGISNKTETGSEGGDVVRDHRLIRYLEKEREKPKMCDAAVQTNLSLMSRKPVKRSMSVSSNSSYDDNSDGSYDSRYSRSRKRTRKDKYYRSSSRHSSSSIEVYNPNIELPESFRSKEEHANFKLDAMNRRILFLGGILDYMDEEYLTKKFERYGDIKLVKIYHRRAKKMRLENGPRSQDFAFITFAHSSGVIDAIKLYKEDYPTGTNFQMSFGGRREFCAEQYSDLDNQPLYFPYGAPKVETKPEKENTFESMLEEYKKHRSQIPTAKQPPVTSKSTRSHPYSRLSSAHAPARQPSAMKKSSSWAPSTSQPPST